MQNDETKNAAARIGWLALIPTFSASFATGKEINQMNALQANMPSLPTGAGDRARSRGKQDQISLFPQNP
jgi:hypothetical protein